MKLPAEFIIYDLEYTAWEGSAERDWSGPQEHPEVIEIGAIRVQNFQEVDSFQTFVMPKINPVLSEYIIALTGITQENIESKGISFARALKGFSEWSNGLVLACYGRDAAVLQENCKLNDTVFPFGTERLINLREYINDLGIESANYMSSTLSEAFGINSPFRRHDGLNDARSLLIALRAAANQH